MLQPICNKICKNFADVSAVLCMLRYLYFMKRRVEEDVREVRQLLIVHHVMHCDELWINFSSVSSKSKSTFSCHRLILNSK